MIRLALVARLLLAPSLLALPAASAAPGGPIDRAALQRNVRYLDGRLITPAMYPIAKRLRGEAEASKLAGKHGAAERQLDRSVRILQGLMAADPKSDEYRRSAARTLSELGELHNDLGHATRAVLVYHQALEIRRQMVKEHPGDDGMVREVARILQRVGRIHDWHQQSHEALVAYAEAVTLLRRLFDRRPDSRRRRAELASTLQRMAEVRRRRKEWPEAREAFQMALGLFKRDFTPEGRHAVQAIQQKLASMENKGTAAAEADPTP